MPDLDPAYLAGDWCYVSITAGSNVEPEHITYRFNPDGTLLYQNATGTPLDRPGNWSSEGGRVVIKPTLMMFKLHVKEQQPDRLVLSGMGDMLFTRGACGTPG